MRLELEGRSIEAREGDTIASALYRSGVRVFSRSFKLRRPRGLYCLTGDCPNCLMTVDGEPGVRTCVTPARDGARVSRERGWPSAERDALRVLDRLGWLFPVGFYYKMLLRPRWAWPRAEKLVRRLTGVGSIDMTRSATERESVHEHPDVLVIGAGVAGLSAALEAAARGADVMLVDEGEPGALTTGPCRSRVLELLAEVRADERIRLLQRSAAVGVYEGPLVPVVAPELVHLVRPGRVIVCTGAVERHAVFAGSDLPGVWLGRGAARLAETHAVAPAGRAVVVGSSRELADHVVALEGAGVEIVAAVIPGDGTHELPSAIPVHPGAEVVAVRGRRHVKGVRIRTSGGEQTIACDAVVVSSGLVPRNNLLRQSGDGAVIGAGDVVSPGCTLREAEESGRLAARQESVSVGDAVGGDVPTASAEGVVCLCEDVKVSDLRQAWSEGFRSTELLKRYTTVTMGPCQGALCRPHLTAFARAQGADAPMSAPTTARPPARPVRLEDVAAGIHVDIEHRTALHQRHLDLGATMEWLGAWKRPERYGDVLDEYWAVRRGVSVMDVGTLGKFLISGPDATDFLEQIYPCHVADLEPGAMRYALLLNEAGFVLDDGMVCALDDGRYYCTLSTGGADHGEAWLRQWLEFFGLRVNLMNRTAALGAINVAGPRARELLSRLCEEPLDNEALPYVRHLELEVAGVPCRVLRLGFVGELSYELHHAARHSGRLWDALLESGADLEIRPHGVEALRLLRLEKGHILVGQDTDFDSTPEALGLGWAARLEKDAFIGKRELERLAEIRIARKLTGFTFEGEVAPPEGAQLEADGRHAGYLTSSRFSPALGKGVALGFLTASDGVFPSTVVSGSQTGTVVEGAFYDPAGDRLRA